MEEYGAHDDPINFRTNVYELHNSLFDLFLKMESFIKAYPKMDSSAVCSRPIDNTPALLLTWIFDEDADQLVDRVVYCTQKFKPTDLQCFRAHKNDMCCEIDADHLEMVQMSDDCYNYYREMFNAFLEASHHPDLNLTYRKKLLQICTKFESVKHFYFAPCWVVHACSIPDLPPRGILTKPSMKDDDYED